MKDVLLVVGVTDEGRDEVKQRQVMEIEAKST